MPETAVNFAAEYTRPETKPVKTKQRCIAVRR